jgi:hypothetical protein
MSASPRQIRRVAAKESAVLGRQPVNKLTEIELMEELIGDVASSLPTPLERMVPALDRIARLRTMATGRKTSVDSILTTIQDEAAARMGGFARMPGTAPGYKVGDSGPI